MKKLIPILFALFLLSGCDKGEDTYCWRFDKTKKFDDGYGYVKYEHSSSEQCDLTEAEAEQMRKSFDAKYEYNGYIVTVSATKTKL